MVNLNADRNLPPDSTPWGKNIERRLNNLERDKRLEESNSRNTNKSLSNTINRLNLGTGKVLESTTGLSGGSFDAPIYPPTSSSHNPATINSYDYSPVGVGKKLVTVSSRVSQGQFRLQNNSSESMQLYTIVMGLTLTASPADGWNWWSHKHYIPLFAQSQPSSVTSPPWWVTPTTNLLHVDLMDPPSTMDTLYVNVDEYRLFYGGNEILPNQSSWNTITLGEITITVYG